MKSKKDQESGFILIAVLVILSLSLLVAVGMVSAKKSEAMVQTAVNEQSADYYVVEKTMNKTVS